jgi:hypothetical protein
MERLHLTSVAVAQPHIFQQKSPYFSKLDFKITFLMNGCFFVCDLY